MPSYTEEQKRKAVETVEECGGSVTRAIRRLGYPSRQTMYQWLNQRDASHERRAGRLCLVKSLFRKGTAVGILDQSGTGGEPHVQPGAEEARDRDLHQIRP